MLPLLSIDAMIVEPYLNTNLPPDSSTVKLVVAICPAVVAELAVVADVAVVADEAVVADVAVAALPLMLMAQVPDAPDPVGEGTSVPMANPRAVRAAEPVVAPVPPFAIASVPAKVIVPDDVIGLPEVVRPVVPPESATDVTVPVPGAVADRVPAANVRFEPIVTLLNPPEPLPYRMDVPEVAGA